MWYDKFTSWLEEYPIIYENLKFAGVLLFAYLAYLISKKIILPSIRKIIQRTKTEYDDLLLNEKLLRRISYIAPLVVISSFTYLLPTIEVLLDRVSQALIGLTLLMSLGTLFSSITDLLQSSEKFRDRPIKGYMQVVKIIMYIFGTVILVGVLTGESPWALLGGISALTAIILLVFKDTILSFVVSIQISSYDLIKVGDWIEVPKYSVDGDVMDISLHTIKIRNFDKTISVIPTHQLIEASFKNWRGMQETGARRIKRAINIDLGSVKFCTNEMLDKFKRFQLIQDYIQEKIDDIENYNKKKKFDTSELINGRRLTNLGTFRAYIKAYLNYREDIRKDLTFLIRQLPPGPEGIPIELYVFANTTAWIDYEEIQADLFDHLLAVVPSFELRVYQNPTGHDFNMAIKNQERQSNES
ncbi:MAG: mechanosensitive ion channel family protein [Melioribacteraceae bacterium]|nr:mechanosensitive ion channel family protein [Melioribacteraceae bacterium]MCF8354033.1 mechanosensitive ion channel family protein [Melioribacteraceae bacterium]MCF8392286.1 mechanosensitive ion channel family protein [Melioribacteraceae bacterium]MCF8417618.1 mechanosensitive ion channel family protein [Melioribacteraceae bacterium]